MPELPEVETTRRGLLPVMKGAQITQLLIRRRDLRFPVPRSLEKVASGAEVTDITRRAKYLLIHLASGARMLVHLGMSGSLRTENPQTYQPRTHDHAVFTLQHRPLVVFHDPRRFGVIDILPDTIEEKEHPLLSSLGPEPLSKHFTPRYLAAALARRKGAIKPVLMDQKLVVGVGNIYASESLFLAKVDPTLAAHRAASHSEAIVNAVQTTLKRAIAAGGSTLRDYVGAQGESGYFQHEFLVYERAGERCARCHDTIVSMVQSQRATYYCPSCQAVRRTHKKR